MGDFKISDKPENNNPTSTALCLVENINVPGEYYKVPVSDLNKGFLNGITIDDTNKADGYILAYNQAENKFQYVENTGGSGGSGDMTKAVYDPQTIEGDSFDRTNHTGEQDISTVTNLQAELDSKQRKAEEISPNQEITFNGETKSQIDQTTDLNFTVAASQPNAPIGSGMHYETVTIRGNSSNAITTNIPISNNQTFDNTKENTFVVSYDPNKESNKAIGYIGKVDLIVAPTQPLYISSEIGNIDDQTLTFTVDQNSNYDITGLSLTTDSVTPLNFVANTAGDGTATANYSLDRAVLDSETITITASVSNGVTGVNGGLIMVDFTNEAVTNNVAAPSQPQRIYYDFTGQDFTNSGSDGVTYDLTTPTDGLFQVIGGKDCYRSEGSFAAIDRPIIPAPISGIDYVITCELYVDLVSMSANSFLFAENSGSSNTGVECFARSNNSLTQLNTDGSGGTTSNTINLQSWNTYIFSYDSIADETTITLNGTDSVISGGVFSLDEINILTRTYQGNPDVTQKENTYITNLSVDWT